MMMWPAMIAVVYGIIDRVAENIVGQNAYHVFPCLIFLSYLCRVILLFL